MDSSEMGKLGGKARTPAKVAAARSNARRFWERQRASREIAGEIERLRPQYEQAIAAREITRAQALAARLAELALRRQDAEKGTSPG